MQIIGRILIGLNALAALAIFALIYARPLELAGALGVSGEGALGLATIRADMGGFFGAWGLFCFVAALTGRRGLLLAPIALLGFALVGRLFTYVTAGGGAEALQPILVEVVSLTLILLGRALMGRSG